MSIVRSSVVTLATSSPSFMMRQSMLCVPAYAAPKAARPQPHENDPGATHIALTAHDADRSIAIVKRHAAASGAFLNERRTAPAKLLADWVICRRAADMRRPSTNTSRRRLENRG
jgi:hypothetical protein